MRCYANLGRYLGRKYSKRKRVLFLDFSVAGRHCVLTFRSFFCYSMFGNFTDSTLMLFGCVISNLDFDSWYAENRQNVFPLLQWLLLLTVPIDGYVNNLAAT